MNGEELLAHAPVPETDLESFKALLRPREPRMQEQLLVAATRPRNWCLLLTVSLTGALVCTGLFLSASAIGALGAGLYSLQIARDLRTIKDPFEEEIRTPLHYRSSLDDLSSAELSELCKSIISRHEKIRKRLLSSSPSLRAMLRDSYRRCTQMAAFSEVLVRRGCYLHEYLSGECVDHLQSEIRLLEANVDGADDEEAKLAFLAGVQEHREHLTTYHKIQGLYDRVKGQLSAIKANLDCVEARLINLRGCDLEQSCDAVFSFQEHLDATGSELESLESSMQEALA